MPHVSQRQLDKKVEKELLKTLDLVLTKLTKEEEMQSFLLSLTTPTEKLMLAKRLAMIILLKEGYSQSQIAAMLHVTRGTVFKMQLFMEARGQGYDLALQKIQNEKAMQELKGALVKLAGYTIRAAGGRVKPSIF